MDVNLTSQVPLPQGQQQQTAPNATNQSGATSTVQNVPDNVVTAATDATETSAREDDALRRQDRSEREQAIASLQDFQTEGLRTRVGFDAESDRVFLEILAPQTEEVIQRIPSENLIEFLQTEVDPVAARSSSAQTLDASI